MKYKCVISDIDGTLLRSDKTLSPETKKILEELMEQGIPFIPATGRAFYSLPEVVLSLKGLKYAITSNGVSVVDVDNKKVIHRTCLDSEFVEQLLSYMDEETAVLECFVAGRPYVDQIDYDNWGMRGGNPTRQAYIKATRKPVENIREFIWNNRAQMDCIDLTVDPEKRSEIAEAIKERFSGIYITNSDDNLLEISHKDSGKQVGIDVICKLLNITPEEIIAFGDNDNDVEMLSQVGLGVAVSNGTQACKKAADMVTRSNDQDAVAYELEKLMYK